MGIIMKKADLKWSGKLKPIELHNFDAVAIHHMAHTSADLEEIHRWHLAKSWAGCGYNFWVDKQGVWWEVRGFNQGAGVLNHNHHILSVGFQGDYDGADTYMPVPQFNTGVQGIKWLKEKCPNITKIAGHKYWNATSCPGKYFPLEEMVTAIEKEEPTHWAEPYYEYLTKDKGIVIHDKHYDKSISRGEVFALLARALGYKEL